MENKPPLFTVVIPTFNSELQLNIALKSLENQSFKNFEVLIIDGESSDNTLEIANDYKNRIEHLVIISERDNGIYDAMNKGIDKANGEWLYFMGSDDWLVDNDVLQKISICLKEDSVDVLYGNITSPRFGGIYDGVFTPKKLMTKNICHQAIFINKRVFKLIGNFNLKYKSHADWDHNIKWFLSPDISIKYIDLVIANYADGGYSSRNDDLVFKEFLRKKFPLVSICIPTYNGSEFIAEAMNSAISQTFPNLEIVISDDASKDDTINLIESFKKKTEIPIYIHHHQPSGIGANWNHSVKKANGEYIKFLFQDDVLMPTCIERMFDLIGSNENVGLVYCKREIICKTNDKFNVRWLKRFGLLHNHWNGFQVKEGILSGKEYLYDEYLLKDPLNKIGEPPAVLLHKSIFEKVGYFNTKLKQELDFEFWYRLMPYFNVGFVDEKLIKFRLHSNQATQVNKSTTTKDSTLSPLILFKYVFKYLHRSQQKKLLKMIVKNTQLYVMYNRISKKLKI